MLYVDVYETTSTESTRSLRRHRIGNVFTTRVSAGGDKSTTWVVVAALIWRAKEAEKQRRQLFDGRDSNRFVSRVSVTRRRLLIGSTISERKHRLVPVAGVSRKYTRHIPAG